jgi:hypothetical protein
VIGWKKQTRWDKVQRVKVEKKTLVFTACLSVHGKEAPLVATHDGAPPHETFRIVEKLGEAFADEVLEWVQLGIRASKGLLCLAASYL